jgi:hypothetical protein
MDMWGFSRFYFTIPIISDVWLEPWTLTLSEYVVLPVMTLVDFFLSLEQNKVGNRIQDQSWKGASENWVLQVNFTKKRTFTRRQIFSD